jgi:uncharacterized membrane protein
MNVKRGEWVICVALFFFLSSNIFVFAEEINISDENLSIRCLNSSRMVLTELERANFSVVRVNDTLKEASFVFDSQQIFEEKGKQADYSKVLSLCAEITALRDLAFSSRDQINSLTKFYGESSKELESSEVDALFSSIAKEMKDERYELVPGLVEQAYTEITLAQSKATALNVFYRATTRGLKTFFIENWKILAVSFVLLFILFVFLKTPVERYLLQRRLKRIEFRRQTLKDIITKNQDIYFNKGKISEEEFMVKNKKLAELVREVDRQAAIVREQLASIGSAGKLVKKGLSRRAK